LLYSIIHPQTTTTTTNETRCFHPEANPHPHHPVLLPRRRKQGGVLSEDYQQQQQQKRKTGKNKKDDFISSISVNVVSDEKQLQQMMKAQKQKEKQELKSYIRKRDTEKRTRNILLLQSRRVKDGQNLVSVKVFDEYEEYEGSIIWKHNCHRLNSDDCKDCFYGSIPIYSI